MRPFRVFVLASLVAVVAAACGSAGHPPGGSSSPSADAKAAANELAFIDGLGRGGIITVDPRLVAGPVMSAYILFQHESTAAGAAVGNSPDAPATRSAISGGYRLCSGGDCHNYTAFTTNAAGQITGLSVNGEPVAGRIATGPSSSAQSLSVSEVVAYRRTGTQDVTVAFKAHDVSYGPFSGFGDPAILATFTTSRGKVSADSDSSLPTYLSPGDTVYVTADFLLTDVPGTLELTSNDGHNLQLALISLTKP